MVVFEFAAAGLLLAGARIGTEEESQPSRAPTDESRGNLARDNLGGNAGGRGRGVKLSEAECEDESSWLLLDLEPGMNGSVHDGDLSKWEFVEVAAGAAAASVKGVVSATHQDGETISATEVVAEHCTDRKVSTSEFDDAHVDEVNKALTSDWRTN